MCVVTRHVVLKIRHKCAWQEGADSRKKEILFSCSHVSDKPLCTTEIVKWLKWYRNGIKITHFLILEILNVYYLKKEVVKAVTLNCVQSRVERCTPLEYMFLNECFANLHTSVTLMFIYCRCKLISSFLSSYALCAELLWLKRVLKFIM